MATLGTITTAAEALAAVPPQRLYTAAAGSAFPRLLAEARFEAECWRNAQKSTAHPEWAWRKLGAYAVRTIALKLRARAEREAARLAGHTLAAAADAVDVQAERGGFTWGDDSRAFAVLAYAADRPALGSRCLYGSNAVDRINRGEASVEALAASPLDLAGAVALNAAGKRLIGEARAMVAVAKLESSVDKFGENVEAFDRARKGLPQAVAAYALDQRAA